MTVNKPPKLFRVRTAEDLERIPFENGMAAVEVPADLLHLLELKHETRGESLRLEALERSIRLKGFQPIEPITARIGRRGRWVVVNGGHRITAARKIMREFWTNLFGKKVESFYFILFTNPESWSKSAPPPGVTIDPDDADAAAEMRESWDRAEARMRALENQRSRN
ncbi:MAG: ParB/Srx family N-terminal domain-containing protein [Pseudomonadota bacterium]